MIRGQQGRWDPKGRKAHRDLKVIQAHKVFKEYKAQPGPQEQPELPVPQAHRVFREYRARRDRPDRQAPQARREPQDLQEQRVLPDLLVPLELPGQRGPMHPIIRMSSVSYINFRGKPRPRPLRVSARRSFL